MFPKLPALLLLLFSPLAAAGVAVAMDNPAVVTHAKALIIDGRTVLLGSTNWSASALTRDVEADVLIRFSEAFSQDPRVTLVPVPSTAVPVAIPLGRSAGPAAWISPARSSMY